MARLTRVPGKVTLHGTVRLWLQDATAGGRGGGMWDGIAIAPSMRYDALVLVILPIGLGKAG